jgi:GNAT superfamily N-acetyltransferase
MNTIQYREFQRETELEQRRSLFLKCFPETAETPASTPEYYAWKYNSPIYPLPRFEFGAYDGNRLVGYYAGIELGYLVRGVRERVVLVFDVMTDPDYQGKGIFTALGKYSTERMQEQGISFTTGYPIRPGVIPGHLKAGWVKAFPLPLHVRPIQTDLFLPPALRFIAPVPNQILRFTNALLEIPGKSGSSHFAVTTQAYRGKSLNDKQVIFLQKWCSKQTIALEKTPEFYRWRFSAPGTEYFSIEVCDGESIVGLAMVSKCVLKETPTVAILDFMVLDHSSKVSDLMHYSILSLANRLHVTYVATMVSRELGKRIRLLRHGYLKSPYQFFLILKLLKENGLKQFVEEPSAWNLMWVDSDDL